MDEKQMLSLKGTIAQEEEQNKRLRWGTNAYEEEGDKLRIVTMIYLVSALCDVSGTKPR